MIDTNCMLQTDTNGVYEITWSGRNQLFIIFYNSNYMVSSYKSEVNRLSIVVWILPYSYIPTLTWRKPRRVLSERQMMLCLHEQGVRVFQAFVRFVFVFSFSLFQICVVSLDYALLISHIGILHWTSWNSSLCSFCFRFIFKFVSNLSCLFDYAHLISHMGILHWT